MKEVPIRFAPLYKERVWGGRSLETVYGRSLPKAGVPYGESWELSDREGDETLVVGGEFGGLSLGELWRGHREAVFGKELAGHPGERFPLLVKILDAREDLSLQVHPPAEVAEELGGEPKTEMWVVAAAEPGAKIYIGLREGVTREDFEEGIRAGTAAELVGELSLRAGDFVHLPSGRLHAIGAGLLIFEVQENSDTTYRVFDWNRLGLDGRARDLHVEEAMRSIDFGDVSAGLGVADGEVLVRCAQFEVRRRELAEDEVRAWGVGGACSVVAVVEGRVRCGGMEFEPGAFFLIPAGIGDAEMGAVGGAAVLLRISIPPTEP